MPVESNADLIAEVSTLFNDISENAQLSIFKHIKSMYLSETIDVTEVATISDAFRIFLGSRAVPLVVR